MTDAFRIGQVTGRVVTDGAFDYDLDFLFPGIPDAERRTALGGRLDAERRLRLPWDCMLLTTPSGTVLIDAGGGGRGRAAGSADGWLRDSLADAGVAPGDIDVVVITHAHIDHIGGLVGPDGNPVFGAARHLLARTEWEAWTSEEVLAALPGFLADPARRILPALERAGLLDLAEGEAEVVPGVTLVPAPGHTPGHSAVAVRDGSEQALLLADAVLDDVLFEHPDWIGVPDMDPEQLVRTRHRLLDQAAADGALVLGYHLEGAGHVERWNGAYRFVR